MVMMPITASASGKSSLVSVFTPYCQSQFLKGLDKLLPAKAYEEDLLMAAAIAHYKNLEIVVPGGEVSNAQGYPVPSKNCLWGGAHLDYEVEYKD